MAVIDLHSEPKAKFVDYKTFTKWSVIRDLEELKSLFINKKVFAFDTETNGLDYSKIRLCGFSLSFDGINGYYIPIRHLVDVNADRLLLDYVVEMICTDTLQVLMYNKKFDLNVLELSEGYNIGVRSNVLDIMEAVWLRDTYAAMPSLKASSEYFLGIIQPKYDEVTGGKTFDYVKAEDMAEYASLDAICTYKLAVDTFSKNKDIKAIFDIDNRSIEAMRFFEREKVRLDIEWLNKEKTKVFFRIKELEQQLYKIVGYEFNINSGKQLAEALIRMGVVLTEKTTGGKTGKTSWKTDIDTLSKIDHPVKDMLIEHSHASQYLSTFVNGLLEGADSEGYIRFNYKLMQVVTGRFSSGGDTKNTYYSGVNAQNLPKPLKDKVRVIQDETSATGWRIEEDISKTIGLSGYVCETGSYVRGVRCAFLPCDEESVLVSMDYAGQEVRIAANFSGEPVFVESFKRGEDPHMNTARAIWGPDVGSEKKPQAKGANFALQYGGGAYTLQTNLGISKKEAEKLYNDYRNTMRSLVEWQSYMKKKARRDGVVYSAFGRPFRLARYFKEGLSWGIQGSGERYAMNYVIQGTGGDVIRIALTRMLMYWLKVKPLFSFVSTVHDEINTSVKKTFLKEYMKVAPKLMTIKDPSWEVPLIVETSIGNNWLRLIKYDFDDQTYIFTPKGKYVDKFEDEKHFRNILEPK